MAKSGDLEREQKEQATKDLKKREEFAYKALLKAIREEDAKKRAINLEDEKAGYRREIPEEYQVQKVKEALKHISSPSAKSFDVWQSAMMELMGAMAQLVGATAYSDVGGWNKLCYAIGKHVLHQAKELAIGAGQKVLDTLPDLTPVPVLGRLLGGRMPEVGAVVSAVSMDKNKKLNIGPIKFRDGTEIYDPLTEKNKSNSFNTDNSMRTLVSLWLSMHGFTPKQAPNEGEYQHTDGTTLDKTKFDELKDLKENGLGDFLTKTLGSEHTLEDLEQHVAAPTHSPAPKM